MEIVPKKGIATILIDGISAIFMPIIGLLSAAGILKGLIAILTTSGVLDSSGQTHLVLNAMSDSLFYFLPILLAFTAARKFGSDPFVAVVIAGSLLYPGLTTALEEEQIIYFLGLPLRAVTYHSSVIPIIMACGLLVFVERVLKKCLPKLIHSFMVPLLSIFIVGTVTLFAFGPIGAVIGDVLAGGYGFIYGVSPILAGMLLGAFIQPMAIFGFHWSFILIGMNNIMLNGQDTVLALMGPPVFSQAAAALAVLLKSKDRSFKSICASAVMSALFGITEPAMFGVNLPRKKPLIAVCIGGGVGGILAGYSGARAIAFAFPGLASLPVFFGPGFVLYMAGCGLSMLVTFILTMVLHFEVDPRLNDKASDDPKEAVAKSDIRST